MAGGEGVMPHLHLARGERKDRGTAMGAGASSEKKKKNYNNQTLNQINNPTKTQQGQEQRVETGHKAEQDLGCKTADEGQTDWKDKMVDVHVGQRQKENNTGSERWGLGQRGDCNPGPTGVKACWFDFSHNGA